MSFSWNSHEDRRSSKLQQEKDLKQFLLAQQQEQKARKLQEKQRDVEESRRLLNMQSNLNDAQRKGNIPNSFVASKQSNDLRSSLNDAVTAPLAPLPSLVPQPVLSYSTDPAIGIKYLEDRLDQERRAREAVDSELRAGKGLIAQLAAKVDALQTQMYNQQQVMSMPKDNTDVIRVEMKKELEKMGESYYSQLAHLNAENHSLKSQINQIHEIESKKFKNVIEEVDQLKTFFANFMSKTSELHQEHASKENILMIEQAKTSGIPPVVSAHDQWIQNFQKVATQKFSHIETAINLCKNDINVLAENDSKLRVAVDQTIKDSAKEINNNLQLRLGAIESDVRSSMQTSKEAKEVSVRESQKVMAAVSENVKALIQKVSDNRAEVEEAMKHKLRVLEDWLMNEQTQSVKREAQLRQDMELGLKQLEARSVGHANVVREDVQVKMSQLVKSLETTIHLVEEATMVRMEKLEKVLKAEVDQRLEIQKRHEAEITKLIETLGVSNAQISALKTGFREENDKMRVRIEAVQGNLKDTLQAVAGDVSTNRKLLSQLQRGVEESQASMALAIDSDKQAMLAHVESSTAVLRSGIDRVQAGLDELRNELVEKDVKIEFLAGETNTNKGKLTTVQALKKQVEELDAWKNAIPESVFVKQPEPVPAAVIEQLNEKIAYVENVISQSNILRAKDLMAEFNKIKSLSAEDHAYLQDQLAAISARLDQAVTQDVYKKTNSVFQSNIDSLVDQQRLLDADMHSIRKKLSTKISQSQWEAIDVHVKNLKDNLNGMSEWIHENAAKQSNDVHKLLVEIQQNLTKRQKQNLVQIEQVKDSVEKKIDAIAITVHEQGHKNEQFEQSIHAKLKIQDDATNANLENIKVGVQEAIKDNQVRVDEIDRHVDVLKQTMVAFVDEKLIPLATKSDLLAFDSNLKLLSNELRTLRDNQRNAFEQLRSDVEFQMRKLSSEGAAGEKQLMSTEISNLRAALRLLQEQYEQKHSEHIETVRDLTMKFREIESKMTQGEVEVQMTDGRVQDLASQVRYMENEIRSVSRVQSPPVVAAEASRPFSAENELPPALRPLSGGINESKLSSRPFSGGVTEPQNRPFSGGMIQPQNERPFSANNERPFSPRPLEEEQGGNVYKPTMKKSINELKKSLEQLKKSSNNDLKKSTNNLKQSSSNNELKSLQGSSSAINKSSLGLAKSRSKTELISSKSNLGKSKEELSASKNNLSASRNNLGSSRNNLGSSRNELAKSNQKIAESERDEDENEQETQDHEEFPEQEASESGEEN